MDRDALMISFIRGTPRVISDFAKKTQLNVSKIPDFSPIKINFSGFRQPIILKKHFRSPISWHNQSYHVHLTFRD